MDSYYLAASKLATGLNGRRSEVTFAEAAEKAAGVVRAKNQFPGQLLFSPRPSYNLAFRF